MDGGSGTNSKPQLVNDDFKISGAAISQSKAREHAPDTCTICLEPISDRAVAGPCNHLTFDFLCLVSWLEEQPTCPLCKAPVEAVQYEWRSAEDYKTYNVPKRKRKPESERYSDRGRRQPPSRLSSATWASESGSSSRLVSEDPALQRRRHVYRERTYALHVGTNATSRYREFTCQAFAASPELQSRARAFLRRELKVFTFLDATRTRRGGNTREFLVEYVIAVLKVNELKGANGNAVELVTEFLGKENAGLLLHELEAWLRSPFSRVETWDEHVQYRPSAGESKG